MKKEMYLFDTHALIFWNNKEFVSEGFVNFFNKQVQQGRLYISSISSRNLLDVSLSAFICYQTDGSLRLCLN